jgi:hypothetical protein
MAPVPDLLQVRQRVAADQSWPARALACVNCPNFATVWAAASYCRTRPVSRPCRDPDRCEWSFRYTQKYIELAPQCLPSEVQRPQRAISCSPPGGYEKSLDPTHRPWHESDPDHFLYKSPIPCLGSIGTRRQRISRQKRAYSNHAARILAKLPSSIAPSIQRSTKVFRSASRCSQ